MPVPSRRPVHLPLSRSLPSVLLAVILTALALCPGAASARALTRTVHFRGLSLHVPTSWPVLRLSQRPDTCVRFDRHAVYLGTPNPRALCPVGAAGRTEAILVEPGAHAHTGLAGPQTTLTATHGLTVTATWNRNPGVIRRALGVRLLRPARVGAAVRGPRAASDGHIRRAFARRAVSSAAPALPGQAYSGEGFDTCSTPSQTTMSEWASSSPYGAVGVYIGGQNMACAQTNLTASWVNTQSAAGWHIVPIYVGLQAPGNACGCASLSPSSAASEGSAAAQNAAAEAAAIGLGTGNPIYYDMEGYSRGGATSTAVLTFLQAWTQQLHAEGYLSGIYSSDDSGVADLVSQYGTGYTEPDDLWFAAWNGQATTQDGTIPASEWANSQRLHQFQGGVNETYGGATENVDNDELDAATAAYGSTTPATSTTAVAPPAPPVASTPPTLSGIPVVGQTLSEAHGSWSGDPSGYSVAWYRCSRTGTACTAIPGATAGTYTLTPADAGHRLKAAEVAANSAGHGAPATSTPTAPVAAVPGGPWAFTADGGVLNSEYELLWGQPAPNGLHDFVGMAAARGRRGYWLVTRYARVDGFGDAPSAPPVHTARPVTGIVRAATAGYWLLTAAGNVYAERGAPFLGSLASRHLGDVSGMAALPNAPGYWLVRRTGAVFAFGRAPQRPGIRPAHPVIGIVAAPNHSYWLYTADGNVYNARGAGFYGSPARDRVHDVVGMVATPDGRGYWLLTAAGQLFAYGDATALPGLSAAGGALLGLAG